MLHTALRRVGAPAPLMVGGDDIDALVRAERARMLDFAEARARRRRSARARDRLFAGGQHRHRRVGPRPGHGGRGAAPIHRTPHRGSPLCPTSMAASSRISSQEADPARTLFIICSKTFTTLETRSNALVARALDPISGWAPAAVPQHFAAVRSTPRPWTNSACIPTTALRCGTGSAGAIRSGPRSAWRSPSRSAAAHFEAFCSAGPRDRPSIFVRPWAQNLPVLAAMLGVWNIDLLGLPTLPCCPTTQRLARLPAYLQQLEMESNGKQSARWQRPRPCPPAP